MGLTQNLGRLSPSIFSDASLNIGVGAAPSGSYKFEVTGTSKISGVLTLGSTLSNGTYTYTLPSATGTLALVGGAGVGTVTSVAALTIGTTGTDLSSSVANSTTTPVITLNVPTASATNRGVLASADWTTFNNKQGTITLTTTGTSGAATFSANTLNIPNYGSALSGYLPLTGGTLTGALNGTSASFTSTAKVLEVKQSAAGSATYYVFDNTVEATGKKWRFGYTGAVGDASTFSLYNETDSVVNFVAKGGNLGIGVTPSVWTLGKVIEIGNTGHAIWSVNATQYNIMYNAYYNGGFVYASSNPASYYQQASGAHTWYNAPSGTIGTAITFTSAMSLFANGGLGLNTTTPTTSTGYHTFSLNSSTGGQIEFQTAGAGKAFIYSNSTDLRFYTSGGAFRFENTTGLEVGYSAAIGLYKLDVNGVGRFTNQLTAYGFYSTNSYKADGGYYEAVPNYATYGAWNLRMGANAAYACYYITGGGYNILTTEGYNNPYTVKLYSNSIATLTMTNGAATFSGQVGIGVAPSESLTIYGAVIRLEGAAGVSPFAIANNNSSGFRIYDYNAGVDRLLITSAGNVGIGTSSPSAKLVVSNSNALGYEIDPASTSGTVVSLFSYDRTAAAWRTTRYSSLDHRFEINGTTEAMRITSGGFTKISNTGTYGNVSGSYHEIRTNAATNAIIISNTNASPYIANFSMSGTPNNNSIHFLYCEDSTALRINLLSNGGIANYQSNNTNLSDERTKKDIIPLESYWDKFKAIEIVKFKYKDQTHDDFNIGVIAQQVEKVAPEFIDIDGFGETPKDGIPLKTVYTADLHHATIKVLQECMVKIEEQQKQIEELKQLVAIK